MTVKAISPQRAAHGHRPGSARAAMSYPDFRRMWTASFASYTGTWMQNVVLPAYVYERTDSAALVAVLVFAQLGPLLLLSIPAGVVADRFDRRRWLIAMQLVQLAFSAALAPLAANDAPIWALFVVSLGVGTGNALNAPAWSAMLPTLVSEADLPGAIALQSTMINGSRVVGPIIVAVLAVFHVTTAQIFLINAATYLFVVIALLTVHLPRPAHVAMERGWKQFTSGLSIVRRAPASARLLITLAIFSFVALPYIGLFPAVARLNFGIDEESATYKWLYASWGFGACLGALSIGTVLLHVDKRRIVRLGFLGFGACMTGFALARGPSVAFPVGFLLGFAYMVTTTSMSTILQSRLVDRERGRVLALWFMAFGGMIPLGNIAFGPVVDAVGARWVLLAGAACAVVMAWWCDIAAIDRRVAASAGQRPGQPLEAGHAAALDEHGFAVGN
jgi:MFS family permease